MSDTVAWFAPWGTSQHGCMAASVGLQARGGPRWEAFGHPRQLCRHHTARPSPQPHPRRPGRWDGSSDTPSERKRADPRPQRRGETDETLQHHGLCQPASAGPGGGARDLKVDRDEVVESMCSGHGRHDHPFEEQRGNAAVRARTRMWTLGHVTYPQVDNWPLKKWSSKSTLTKMATLDPWILGVCNPVGGETAPPRTFKQLPTPSNPAGSFTRFSQRPRLRG